MGTEYFQFARWLTYGHYSISSHSDVDVNIPHDGTISHRSSTTETYQVRISCKTAYSMYRVRGSSGVFKILDD